MNIEDYLAIGLEVNKTNVYCKYSNNFDAVNFLLQVLDGIIPNTNKHNIRIFCSMHIWCDKNELY